MAQDARLSRGHAHANVRRYVQVFAHSSGWALSKYSPISQHNHITSIFFVRSRFIFAYCPYVPWSLACSSSSPSRIRFIVRKSRDVQKIGSRASPAWVVTFHYLVFLAECAESSGCLRHLPAPVPLPVTCVVCDDSSPSPQHVATVVCEGGCSCQSATKFTGGWRVGRCVRDGRVCVACIAN